MATAGLGHGRVAVLVAFANALHQVPEDTIADAPLHSDRVHVSRGIVVGLAEPAADGAPDGLLVTGRGEQVGLDTAQHCLSGDGEGDFDALDK